VEDQARHEREIDLSVDPPPDLVIEIDSTHESASTLPIYAILGVPEIWRYEVARRRVLIHELRNAAYVEVAASRFFPVMTGELMAALQAFSPVDSPHQLRVADRLQERRSRFPTEPAAPWYGPPHSPL